MGTNESRYIIIPDSEEEVSLWSRYLYFNDIRWTYSYKQNHFRAFRRIIFTCPDDVYSRISNEIKEERKNAVLKEG